MCLLAQCMGSHSILPKILRASLSLPISWFHFCLYYFFIFESLLTWEEERTKIRSSFVGKEGNDPPGLGPARLEQGHAGHLP